MYNLAIIKHLIKKLKKDQRIRGYNHRRERRSRAEQPKPRTPPQSPRSTAHHQLSKNRTISRSSRNSSSTRKWSRRNQISPATWNSQTMASRNLTPPPTGKLWSTTPPWPMILTFSFLHRPGCLINIFLASSKVGFVEWKKVGYITSWDMTVSNVLKWI